MTRVILILLRAKIKSFNAAFFKRRGLSHRRFTVYHTCLQTHSLLWSPELVWPSAGMWSGAGNVWAMKACVYPGYRHPPPPARGNTDTTRTALFMLFDAISFCFLFQTPSFALLLGFTSLWWFPYISSLSWTFKFYLNAAPLMGSLARDISRKKCQILLLK